MKKHFLCGLAIIALLLTFTYTNAQSLQFSQVILVSSTQQVVPAGKVWKVESYWKANTFLTSSTNYNTCTSNDYHSPFMVNGNIYYVLRGVTTGYSALYTCVGNEFPLWLPAGTTLKTICSCDFLSVIEFTVIP
jgi:hypothetical protein